MAPGWRRQRRRLLVRRILVALGVLFALGALVGLLAGYRIVGAARDMRSAKGSIERAGVAIDEGRLADGRAELSSAASHLAKAQNALSRGRLELDVVRALPVAGDNLVELRRSVALANELSNGGVRILDAAAPLTRADGSIEVPLAKGAIPIEAVRQVLGEVRLLASSLPKDDTIDHDPGILVGPVRAIRKRVNEEVVRRRDQLDVVGDALELLVEMSGGSGDRGYLIAVANTAEMRGAGGMVLSYGGLVGKAGDFSLPGFGRIDDFYLQQPIARDSVPTVPDDYLTRWNGFDPLKLWRNATLAGDFTVVAPVLEQMTAVAVHGPVDGVIQIDPQGLAAVLEGVGPVQVPELGEVTADNVVGLVLHDAYVKYPGISTRSDVLKDVAKAAFTKLVEGDYPSLRPLGTALVRAVQGRHIMMHTRSATVERLVRNLGADGSLPDAEGPDSFHLTVQNVSANKLDYFLDTAVDLEGDRRPAVLGHLTAQIVVHNAAPVGVTQPKYIFGPFDGHQVAGLYRGVVTLYLPAGTNVVKVGGDAARYPAVTYTEDGRPFVSYTIDLPAGATHRTTVDLTLAPRRDRPYDLVLVPQPRVRPTVFRASIDTGRAPLSETLPLDRSVVLTPGEKPRGWQPERSE